MITFLYVLRCTGDGYYVGVTANLFQRYQQHLKGTASAYTRIHRPVALIAARRFDSHRAARGAERRLKHDTRERKERWIAQNPTDPLLANRIQALHQVRSGR